MNFFRRRIVAIVLLIAICLSPAWIWILLHPNRTPASVWAELMLGTSMISVVGLLQFLFLLIMIFALFIIWRSR